MASRLYNILAQLVKADRRTLLWTNPNPTAAFSPTTVAVNLSGYDAVDVSFKDYKTSAAGATVRCMKGGSTLPLMNSASGAYIRWRWFQPQSDNSGVKFLDGYQGTTVNNDYATPYQIWGVKLGGVLKALISTVYAVSSCVRRWRHEQVVQHTWQNDCQEKDRHTYTDIIPERWDGIDNRHSADEADCCPVFHEQGRLAVVPHKGFQVVNHVLADSVNDRYEWLIRHSHLLSGLRPVALPGRGCCA